MRWLVALVTLVITLVMVAGGVRIITSQGNAAQLDKAKGMMLNALIGFIILLAAWVIIDTVMKLSKFGAGSELGPWNAISADACKVAQGTYVPGPGGTGSPTTPGGGGSWGNLPLCANSNTACNPQVLQQTGFNATQANVMSCIAMTESSGNPNTPPYNQTHPGSNSSACGLFQITRTTWNSISSHATGCGDFSASCQRAECNRFAALQLVRKNGYSDWTCPNCNNKASGCINKYGGG